MTGRKVNDLEKYGSEVFSSLAEVVRLKAVRALNQQALPRGCHKINKFGDEDLGAKMACMALSIGIGNTDYSLC
jgi:hypothetical protein